jgi:hypothetical protein
MNIHSTIQYIYISTSNKYMNITRHETELQKAELFIATAVR